MDRNEVVRKWILSDSYGSDYKPSPVKHSEALAKALLVCCNADGDIGEAERNWVLGFAASRGCSDKFLKTLSGYSAKEKLEVVLKDRPPAPKSGCRNIVYLAIKACSADRYDAKEKAMIRRLAPMLNVSEQAVSEIETLVREEEALRKKRYTSLWPEGKKL